MIIRATNLLRAAALILIAGVGTFSMPVQRAEAACMPSALAATLKVIRSKFGPVQVISAHRPGARIAGSGNASYHASCRAVDFNPPAGRYSEVVSWLKANHNGGVGTYSCGMNHIHIDTGLRYRLDVKDDSCEIWGPIQGPDWIQGATAEQLKIAPLEKVRVHMTFLGGGLGRKAFTDYPYEAVALSKAVKAPVQVIWTREDDMTMGPFRPGMMYQCRGAVSRGGRIAAFEMNAAGQNMNSQGPQADKSRYNGEIVDGFLKPFFESIPHYRFGDAPLDAPIPVMWWRSVYASTNAFALESFLDEMAVAAGKDPLDFRSASVIA